MCLQAEADIATAADPTADAWRSPVGKRLTTAAAKHTRGNWLWGSCAPRAMGAVAEGSQCNHRPPVSGRPWGPSVGQVGAFGCGWWAGGVGGGVGRTGHTACAWVGLGDGSCCEGVRVSGGLKAGGDLRQGDEDCHRIRLEMRALTREEKKRLGIESGCVRGQEDADGHCGGRRAHTRAGAGTRGRRSKGLS